MIKLMLILLICFSFTYSEEIGVSIDKEFVEEAPMDSLANIVSASPVLKKMIVADYPDSLLKGGVEGSVIANLYLSDSGQVDSLFIIYAEDSLFMQPAKEAMLQFDFEPAINHVGTKIPSIIQYKYQFSLSTEFGNIKEGVNLRGTVKDETTKKFLAGVTIELTFKNTPDAYFEKISDFGAQYTKGKVISVETDSVGKFEFHALPSENAEVIIYHPEYEPARDRLIIEDNKKYRVAYTIEQREKNEIEIMVYGQKESREPVKRTIEIEEMNHIPGAAGDILKVISLLPGVNRQTGGSLLGSAPIFRGAGSDDSRYSIDGVPLLRLFHLAGLRSAYNSAGVERLNVYPGSFSTKYGGSTAGIVEVETKIPEDTIKGYTKLSLIDVEFAIEGPIYQDLSFFLSLRRSWLGDIIYFGTKLAKINEFGQAYFNDINLKLNYELNKNHNLFITLFTANNTFSYTETGPEELYAGDTENYDKVNPNDFNNKDEYEAALDRYNDILWNHPATWEIQDEVKNVQNLTTTVIGWDGKLGNFSNLLRVSYIPSDFTYSINDSLIFESSYNTFYLRDEASLKMNDKITHTIGTDITLSHYESDFGAFLAEGEDPKRDRNPEEEYEDLYTEEEIAQLSEEYADIIEEYEDEYDEEFIYINDFADTTLGVVGAYYNISIKPIKNLEIIPGVRFDYFPEMDYAGSFLPQFSRKQDTTMLKIDAPIEASLRFNSIYNLGEDHKFSFAFGNYSKNYDILYSKNKYPLRAAHVNLGWTWHFAELLSFDVQTYYQNMWNMQEYTYDIDVQPGMNVGLDYDGNLTPSLDGVELDGIGRSYGMEFFLKRSYSKRFMAWINYSLSRSERWNKTQAKWELYEKDQTHNVKGVVSYLFKNNYRLGAASSLVSGDPVYPVNGVRYYDVKGYVEPFYYRDGAEDRMDMFFSLDLRVEKSYYHKYSKLTWFFDIRNVNYFFYKSSELYEVEYYVDKLGIVQKQVTPTSIQFPIPEIGVRVDF